MSPPLELAAVQRDDVLLDRLAVGLDPFDAADETAVLLRGWRADVLRDIEPGAPEEPAPVRASASRRSARPVVVAAVLAALFSLGGVAAAATQASPGSVLWPVTKLVAHGHALSVQARADVRDALRQAQQQSAAGDRAGALATLRGALQRLRAVHSGDGAAGLRAAVMQLETSLGAAPGSGDGAAPAPAVTATPSPPPAPSPAVTSAPTPEPTPTPDPTPAAQPTPPPDPSPGAGGQSSQHRKTRT